MFNKTIGMAPVAEEMMEENAELNMENSMLKSQMSDMEMSMSNVR